VSSLHKKVLIIGIDPGTTAAYAALDTNENIIQIYSSKEFDLSSMITAITVLGYPLLIGTDKKNIPSFVKQFATKCGAKVIAPEEDLLGDEKREIIRERAAENTAANDHERDALACALFAYRRTRAVIEKIKFHLAEIKQEELTDEVIKLVITTEGLPIKTAIDILLKPTAKENIIIKEAIAQKKCSSIELRLYEQIKILENENAILKTYSRNITQETNKKKKDYDFMLNKIQKNILDKKQEQLLNQKEQIIYVKEAILKQKELMISQLNEKNSKLLNYLETADSFVIIRKLKNLTADYEQKKQFIKEKDILFIEDASLYSKNTFDEVSKKVKIIITKNPNKYFKESFIILQPDQVTLTDLGSIFLLQKKELEQKLNAQELLSKVISDYQRMR